MICCSSAIASCLDSEICWFVRLEIGLRDSVCFRSRWRQETWSAIILFVSPLQAENTVASEFCFLPAALFPVGGLLSARCCNS